ncbi:hypothetical protein BZA70DRAFT_264732 [Myxozyma melibiosi]|uniref:Uncharacterized protein n=1 Tax=Myxozyma melibiosi TaxID=54550 RepID=A0ABR1FBX5_9ASCO
MAGGKKKTRSLEHHNVLLRASSTIADRIQRTPPHSLSLSQSNSMAEGGDNGRHPPRDRDEHYDSGAQRKDHIKAGQRMDRRIESGFLFRLPMVVLSGKDFQSLVVKASLYSSQRQERSSPPRLYICHMPLYKIPLLTSSHRTRCWYLFKK